MRYTCVFVYMPMKQLCSYVFSELQKHFISKNFEQKKQMVFARSFDAFLHFFFFLIPYFKKKPRIKTDFQKTGVIHVTICDRFVLLCRPFDTHANRLSVKTKSKRTTFKRMLMI